MFTSLAEAQGIQVAAAVALLFTFLIWETAGSFFHMFRSSQDRARHVGRNLLVGLINSVLVAAFFVTAWTLVTTWATNNGFGLLNWLLPESAEVLHVVLAVVLLDCWTYWWHRINHIVPFFWRFHKVHHSDTKMDVSTAHRFHTGEIALSSLFRIPVYAILGVTLWEVVVYETIMFAIVQFHHSNISVGSRVDSFLRLFIVTPNMHKVHHSKIKAETNSNYSSMLSVWDRIGRSFRISDPASIEFGLEESPEKDSLGSIFKFPFQ